MVEELHVVRNQKDTVFRMLFREKKELLELYNALNDSAYNSPDGLTICTLDNAIYMKEYSQYVERVRKYAKSMRIEEAVERAVTECIKDGILADFLSAQRAEVIAVSIFEYNEEEEMRKIRASEYKSGREEGIKLGIEQGIIEICKEMNLTFEQTAEKLKHRFNISEQDAQERVRHYWD